MAISDRYTALIQRLLPQGFAWPREAGTNLYKLCCVLSDTLTRIHLRAEQLIEEKDPRTSFELLTDHEREWGLPDSCSFGQQTVQERKAALINKILSRGGQSRGYFEAIASNLGYEIDLREYRPIVCGETPIATPKDNEKIIYTIGAETDRFYYDVIVKGARATWFRCGESELGTETHLTITTAQDLECILQRLKPAHSHLTTIYQE